MSDEVEIKLKITDSRRIKQKLKALGFTPTNPRVHERNVLYDSRDRVLAKMQCALRLRSAGGKHWLTFKGSPKASQKYKVREELETAVADGEQLRRILTALEFEPVFEYEKYRTSYHHGTGKPRRKSPSVAFDQTLVGVYLELEGPRSWIDRVARQLGFDKADYITASYVALLKGRDQRAHRRESETEATVEPAILASIPALHYRKKKPRRGSA